MEISVVIPTKNRKNDLLVAINSISIQTKMPKELIIIDQSDKQLEINDIVEIKSMFKNKTALIYYHDNNKFLFASEIKAFNCFEDIIDVKNINNEIITNYFQYGYVNSFDTVYHGVKKLKNGCVANNYLRMSSASFILRRLSINLRSSCTALP